MKIKIYFLLGFLSLSAYAQDLNQNPNHKEAFLEYLNKYKKTTLLQGITSQETYVAYDYMEFREKEKKERSYRKHLERLAYNLSSKTYLNPWGWNYYDDWWLYNNNWNSDWFLRFSVYW